MRILILTQWFTPEPEFKGLSFAKELIRRGHEVQVVTGFPNYPGGKLYPGYRVRLFQRETIDGVPVLRAPLYPSHSRSAIGRVLNYGSFALGAGIVGTLLARRADVMYVYHPPATVGFAAWVISTFRRIPFVYDIQDLWPDTLASTGMMNNSPILKLVGSWCQFVYRRAARITVLSSGFKNALTERGVPSEKIEVIYNWCDERQAIESAPDPQLKARLGMEGRFNVLFAGGMGKAQALGAALDAAAILASRKPNVQLVFIGDGIEVPHLRAKAEAMKLGNVRFLARLPMSEVGKVMILADVLFVHLRDQPLFKITIPSKTQAYMAVGRPILMAVGGDADELVREAKAGLCCKPEDPQSIAEAIDRLASMPPEALEEMARSGKRFYASRMSLEAGVQRYEDLFRELSSMH